MGFESHSSSNCAAHPAVCPGWQAHLPAVGCGPGRGPEQVHVCPRCGLGAGGRDGGLLPPLTDLLRGGGHDEGRR